MIKNNEKLALRILVAKAANCPPDDVEIVLDSNNLDEMLFQVDYNDYLLIIGGFERIPGIYELKEHIENLYQSVLNWEENQEN
jgi:hypothetical protein